MVPALGGSPYCMVHRQAQKKDCHTKIIGKVLKCTHLLYSIDLDYFFIAPDLTVYKNLDLFLEGQKGFCQQRCGSDQ
jgi:hypothetical protein